ncbi:MAG TPA: NUDIX hydrolase [Thermoanaerobaculia bacterium]|nr:NUDIX hydrolase [Thermoanaerobaculia bacterium]
MDRGQRPRGGELSTAPTPAPPTEHQTSAGGVVLRDGRMLLISLKGGSRWQLPKGRIEAGESAEQAAVREVEEETGVAGTPLLPLERIEYWFVENGQRIHKTVDYFLFSYHSGTTADYDPREVDGAGWFPVEEALERLSFDNERRVARRAAEEMARWTV